MPKNKNETLCVEDLRHAEYYEMQNTFDDLYAKSKNGDIFTHLMDIILSRENILQNCYIASLIIPVCRLPVNPWKIFPLLFPAVAPSSVKRKNRRMSVCLHPIRRISCSRNGPCYFIFYGHRRHG